MRRDEQWHKFAGCDRNDKSVRYLGMFKQETHHESLFRREIYLQWWVTETWYKNCLWEL